MAIGYSDKKLTQKLGIKQGHIVIVLNAPEDYGHLLFPIPQDCSIYDAAIEPADIIQFFTTDKADLQDQFPKLIANLKTNGYLWISWSKGTSKIKTDLDEKTIREIGSENGGKDAGVIDIDESWSGIKFTSQEDGVPTH